MSNHIDFYFDIISPYAYIAYKKILKINNVNFKLKPILLGGLHNLAGITAPAFNKYKMKNMQNDCELISKKNNISFKWNSKFPINSLSIMRGCLCVEDNKKEEYLNSFFEAYWKEDQDLSNEENIKVILKKLKIDENDFFNSINKQNIKDKLKELTQEAFGKEVFGAPTFIVNNKIFWGQDRLEYALDEIKNI
ncbi:2-hydroxychromene-2-carboxylate isomerase [Candidatus Pelagibacter sp. HIMB1542]|uniref:2-hydroxychromene-2-carboxylate isomerase n=1 Tax=Candidatus Pelagibacter sp. HIMB1542 TaxID=3413346 RepID=UPI003F8767B3